MTASLSRASVFFAVDLHIEIPSLMFNHFGDFRFAGYEKPDKMTEAGKQCCISHNI